MLLMSIQLSKIEPRLRVPQSKSGLPGTDEQPGENEDVTRMVFVDPASCGFPDRETSLLYLGTFLDCIHSVFSFVHAVICSAPSW